MKEKAKNGILKILLFLCPLIMCHQIGAQDDFIFTKKFTKKIAKHNLEFYLPVERWLKVSPIVQDEYLKYDMVLHSPPNVEVRLIIDEDHSKLYPNIEIVKTMAHISSNDDDAIIEITEYPSQRSKDLYGADFVLYADFNPKESFSTYRNGRLMCLYKEGNALIKYILLYDGKLDPYFKMPLKFSSFNPQ